MLTQPKSLKPKKDFLGEIFYIAGGGGDLSLSFILTFFKGMVKSIKDSVI